MKYIIPKFPLEDIVVKEIIAELKKISNKKPDENYLNTEKIDDLFHNPILEWVRKEENKNKKVGHYKDIAKEIRKTPPNIAPWRAVTMGRLSELNLVEWEIGTKSSGKDNMGKSKFCFKKSKK